jgi:PIN domain nuclease of toxin-antitoxin system
MSVLLDTHIALWLLSGDERLPAAASLVIKKEQELFLSVASLWEVVIKHQKAPAVMPVSGHELLSFCRQASIQLLPILPAHVLAVPSLHREASAPPHHDPFDRLLIAQSKAENMLLITHDRQFSAYGEPGVWVVS